MMDLSKITMTPMLKQYLSHKEAYTDCILFFRLGDFYEMFLDDALLASKELDLTLTENRDGGPLFNKSGKVIGLLLGKSLAKKSFSYLKNTSENSSFAIKSSYLKKIMPQSPNKRNKNTVNKTNFNSGINVKNISKEAINNFAFLEIFN